MYKNWTFVIKCEQLFTILVKSILSLLEMNITMVVLEQNQTNAGNKLIAEFMGYVDTGKEHPFTPGLGNTLKHPDLAGVTWTSKLKYHTSWDWLMPVIRKIKDYLNDMPTRPSKNHCCKGDMIEVDIQCRLWEIDIVNTWKHTVEFIKWYNDK